MICRAFLNKLHLKLTNKIKIAQKLYKKCKVVYYLKMEIQVRFFCVSTEIHNNTSSVYCMYTVYIFNIFISIFCFYLYIYLDYLFICLHVCMFSSINY